MKNQIDSILLKECILYNIPLFPSIHEWKLNVNTCISGLYKICFLYFVFIAGMLIFLLLFIWDALLDYCLKLYKLSNSV
jgi:hypothetical protein